MELKLYIRQTKIFNAQQQEVYIAGGNPQALQVNIGQLPANRQWKIYNQFIDVTDSVSDLFKLRLTWTLQRDDLGVVIPNVDQQKKAASGVITFEGEAYQLLKSWLIDDISASLNKVDVQIEHVGCGMYTDWSISATQLTWCEDTECTFDITLKQKEESLTCIKNTLIADNWQGWFGNTKTPTSGKKHPRFSYCNEIRPNGILIAIWFVITLMMPIFTITLFIIGIIWNTIIAIFITILSLFALFSQKLRDKITELENSYIKYSDIKDVVGNFFVESAGCGREHPAPLIRDYISNVCGKCGVNVNYMTAPIFFAEQISLQSAEDKAKGQGATTKSNPHYNACFLGAISAKGVRRFDDIKITGSNKNTTYWWLPENTPLLTLQQFLDNIKTVYNAEWRVVNNTLYFQRKDYWLDDAYTFDFSKTSDDRALLLQGMCFEWDEVKDPVIIQGLYSTDGADTPGNAALSYMNSAVSFGNTLLNPTLDGVMEKKAQLGGTKFRLDGASNDYIFDAMQNVINTSVSSTAIWTTQLFNTVKNYFEEYADYALLVSHETTTLPKILLWDAQLDDGLPMNAKAFRPYVPINGIVGGSVAPNPSPRYNQLSEPWTQWHEPDTWVSGSKANIAGSASYPRGYYTVRGILGGTLYQQPAFLVNYPMYFEAKFNGTLWDWFHWIDDPTYNPNLHQTFSAKIELCCDTLKNRIKPFNDGSNIILGQRVKLPTGFFVEGYINEIIIVYDTQDTLGQHIEIKGRT